MDVQALRKKCENYWYHYKWHTIAGVFAAVMLTILTVDALSREKYDASVMIATQGMLTSQQRLELEDRLEMYLPDFDGNGEVNVMLNVVSMPAEGSQNYDTAMAALAKLSVELSDGESMLFILDESTYSVIGESSIFEPVPEDAPGTVQQGYRWMLRDSFLYDTPALQEFDSQDETFLTMRSSQLPMVSKNEKNQLLYQQSQEFWYNILHDNRINPSKLEG